MVLHVFLLEQPNCDRCPEGYHGKDLDADKHKDRKVYDSCDGCPRGQYGDVKGGANVTDGCKLWFNVVSVKSGECMI